MRFSIRDLLWLTLVVACVVIWRLDHRRLTTASDSAFPIGHVSDSFWETSPTSEAADFTFHGLDFRNQTAELLPQSKRRLEGVALRCEHVSLPIVIESNLRDANLDVARRQTMVKYLDRMGVAGADGRVVVNAAR